MAEKGVIRNYNARMYEAKFLLGALAATLSEDHRIGYVSTVQELRDHLLKERIKVSYYKNELNFSF